jgi:hypothetical protein
MDDVTLTGDPTGVMQCFRQITTQAKAIGLNLNTDKCEVHGQHATDLAAHLNIKHQPTGIKVLGVFISTDKTATEQGKLAKHVPLFNALNSIHPTTAFPLLTKCAVPRFMFLTRTHPTDLALDQFVNFDLRAFDTLKIIAQAPELSPADAASSIAHLPLRLGGLGITQLHRIASENYHASRNPHGESQEIRTAKINDALVAQLDQHGYGAHLKACSRKYASSWLLSAGHYNSNSLSVASAFSAALQTRLLWQPKAVATQTRCECGHLCNGTENLIHKLGCTKIKGFGPQSRHTAVCRELQQFARTHNIQVSAEPFMKQAGGRTDIAFFLDGDIVFADVVVANATCRSHRNKSKESIEQEKTVLKNRIYGADAASLQAELVTFQLDVLGGWSVQAVKLVKRLCSFADVAPQELIDSISRVVQLANGRIILSNRNQKNFSLFSASFPPPNESVTNAASSISPPPPDFSPPNPRVVCDPNDTSFTEKESVASKVTRRQ